MRWKREREVRTGQEDDGMQKGVLVTMTRAPGKAGTRRGCERLKSLARGQNTTPFAGGGRVALVAKRPAAQEGWMDAGDPLAPLFLARLRPHPEREIEKAPQ